MTADAVGKRKGGRPPNPEGTSLSKTMNFRVVPALYDQIATAAKGEGRSISEEVAARLTRSFYQDEIERQRFGDPAVSFLANLFAATASLIQAKTGKSVHGDPETLEAVRDAFIDICDSAEGIFKDVTNVSAMHRRFDRLELKRVAEGAISSAASASISLADIMGR